MLLRTRLIHVLFGIYIIVFLQGCLNVNLKSVLPDQTYYSLDNTTLQQECKKKQDGFGLIITALSPYDTKDILLYNDKHEIKVLPNYKWIDLPKNMVRNAFIKTAANHCIQIEQNPALSQRINTLRININELYVLTSNNEYEAHMYLTYEIMGYDMRRIKDGNIQTLVIHNNPAIALQNAMNEALQKIINEIKK